MEDEARRLAAALEEIRDMTASQPEALNLSPEIWLSSIIWEMRAIATRALRARSPFGASE